MQKFVAVTLISLSIFTASNAMEIEDPHININENGDTITVYKLLGTNSSKANYLLKDNPLTDETTVNEYLSLHSRGSNYALEIGILAAALKNGQRLLAKKVLDFFGTEVNHEDTGKAFPAACSCKDQATAIVMVLELLSRKEFCLAMNSTDAAATLSVAFRAHYPEVINRLLRNNDFAEVIDTTRRFKNLIDDAFRNNHLNQLITFLTALSGYEETSAGLSRYALIKAAETGLINELTALLTPEITKHLSTTNLIYIGDIVTLHTQINDADKATIKQKLETLAYSKGWCIIL